MDGGVWMEAVWTKGGIIIMWGERAWRGEVVESGGKMITCKLWG